MQLLLPSELVDRMATALAEAGRREIGGILMGEHVGPDTFRVKELTIQRKGGTFGTFVRIVRNILGPLEAFFRATRRDYMRFNYLGEWHSHHSFALTPSTTDHRSMISLIDDPQLGANFVVLLLAKLSHHAALDCAVFIYQPKAQPWIGEVVQEQPQRHDHS
jgi:[CysO sulfur-carrier protein]-S-L-cysteine hydrolase